MGPTTADILERRLVEAGHSVTIDAQAAKAGQNIIQSIAESISKSDAIIVILSKSSLFENKIR